MVHVCTDQKLIAGAVKYLDADSSLSVIFVSEDGQYFNTVSKANFHCKNNALRLYSVKRDQLPKKSEKPAEKPIEKPAEKSESDKPKPDKAETDKAKSSKGTGKPTKKT